MTAEWPGIEPTGTSPSSRACSSRTGKIYCTMSQMNQRCIVVETMSTRVFMLHCRQ